MNDTEKKKAIELYELYSAAVGGVNYAGEPLPSGEAFFADPAKRLQQNGWLAVARAVLDPGKVAAVAEQARKAATAAKEATGWRKVLLLLAALVMGAVAFFLQGCTAAQVKQAEAVHELYHELTGKECILVLPVEECKK